MMGARGAVARIVFQGDAPCPQIALDGVQQAMDVRPRPSSGFVVTVCEKLIPPGTKSASILGTPLPVPKNSLTSIVVFGDTGCRRKFQPDCSANEWPFKGLSDNAAASHPDLVIHVGDYLYRGNDTWENGKLTSSIRRGTFSPPPRGLQPEAITRSVPAAVGATYCYSLRKSRRNAKATKLISPRTPSRSAKGNLSCSIRAAFHMKFLM